MKSNKNLLSEQCNSLHLHEAGCDLSTLHTVQDVHLIFTVFTCIVAGAVCLFTLTSSQCDTEQWPTLAD